MSSPLIHIRKRHQIRVEQDGPDVVLLMDGRVVFRAHWQYAEQVGHALLGKAALARRQSQPAPNGS